MCGADIRTIAVAASATKSLVKRTLIAVASGLALADAAVVVLALPSLLLELDTTVEGVAAVIAVYTGVLAIGLPLSAALHGRATGAAGALLFAAASLGCAAADSLEFLLLMRALQAIGASALLAAAFDALDGGGSGRRLWLGAAVAGTAAGPALGGILTEAFDWRAIFLVQAPIALAAAPALLATPIATVREHLPRPPRDVLAAIALTLLSGALTAVVFLLVLLLISGWSVDPLAAAAAVTVLPLAAVAGSFIRGAPVTRAVAGCLLVAGGIACLALLPEASAWWTIVPQLLAGVGMGMAFPALAGELLPERTRGQSAALLSLRHVGITLALVALAPIVAAELDQQVDLARERGTALVLDAALPPTDKIELAPRLFADIESENPRDALALAMTRERRRVAREDRDFLSRLERLEDQLREEEDPNDLLGQIEESLGIDTDDLLSELEGLEDTYGDDLAEGSARTRGTARHRRGKRPARRPERERRGPHRPRPGPPRAAQPPGRPRRRGAGRRRLGVQPRLRAHRRDGAAGRADPAAAGPALRASWARPCWWPWPCRPATRSPRSASRPSRSRSPTPARSASGSPPAGWRASPRGWPSRWSTARPAALGPRARSWCWRSSTRPPGGPTGRSTAWTRASLMRW